ncbi:ATP-binding protein [Vibrio diazotrophicus]|uniref:ATP-binding protein n=1 Tax=Vibrio diazotrophicus TaxID=685 RepID=UPI00142E21D1|nr:ATP-binding protein [Vibrio diazotrophicus]
MLNRRKLIQLALSEVPSETEYLDYKQEINLSSEAGRAKLLRIICAMSNSNPTGRSFIFVGISDSKELIGTSFIDDADFQNAIKGYISNCPKVIYENVSVSSLASNKFIGIISIYPNGNLSEICKKIWKLKPGDRFLRRGSSTDKGHNESLNACTTNQRESLELVRRASVTLESTLNATLAFYSDSSNSYSPRHYVFNDQYVVAVSSWENDDSSLSEVTVQLINEEISFFWSAMEYVNIEKKEQSLVIEELAMIFWKGVRHLIPKKRVEIDFPISSSYQVKHLKLSNIPELSLKDIDDFLGRYEDRLLTEPYFAEILPYELLFAALNGSKASLELLLDRNGGNVDGAVAQSYSDAIRTYEYLRVQ